MIEKLQPTDPAAATALSTLDLEALFDRRIDLVEESAIESPNLRRGIERSRRLIHPYSHALQNR